MAHGDDRSFEGRERVLERFGGHEVEVVGGLVEQQQRRAATPRATAPAAAPAGRPTASGRSGRRRSVARSGAAPTWRRRAVRPLRTRISMHGSPEQIGVIVGLAEVAGDDPGAELGTCPRGPRSAPASSRRKWVLPVPFGPMTATRSPNQISPGVRIGQPVDREVLHDHDALAGAAAAELHVDVLVLGRFGRRTRFLEVTQPRLGGAGARRVGVGRPGADLHDAHVLLEPVALFGPAPEVVVELRQPVLAGLVVRGEPCAVHPCAGPFERQDAARAVGEQLAIVGDVEDGLGRCPRVVRRASSCRARRGSCRARRAAARRRRRGTTPRARGASARRPRTW